ncbi:MAG: rRNA maturation RNase YbeY [Ilumatobacteraceae bacterium]
MVDPDGPGAPAGSVTVVVADEQDEVDVDVRRWAALAEQVLVDEGRWGELTLTFVGRADIHELNREHLGVDAPTDVLSFPLDDDRGGVTAGVTTGDGAVPVLLGDVVVCPAVAASAAPEHAGTLDDELALLVVHGVLHVLGHDHTGDADTAAMQARERYHLERSHWRGPAPPGFSLTHRD